MNQEFLPRLFTTLDNTRPAPEKATRNNLLFPRPQNASSHVFMHATRIIAEGYIFKGQRYLNSCIGW